MTEIKTLLRRAMDEQNIPDNVLRAGIAAIIGGETQWMPRTETSYRNTSVARIRTIFKDRVAHLSDDALNRLKRNDEAFFELVYGGEWGRKNLGNTEPGDGYRWRGRGPNQMTGRYNYGRAAKLSNRPQLMDDPDSLNDPEVGIPVAVAFLLDRYKGDGWEGLKSVQGGFVTGEKDKLFKQYLESGEFDAKREADDETAGLLADARAAIEALQERLQALDFYPKRYKIDGIWGPGTEKAVDDWQATQP